MSVELEGGSVRAKAQPGANTHFCTACTSPCERGNAYRCVGIPGHHAGTVNLAKPGEFTLEGSASIWWVILQTAGVIFSAVSACQVWCNATTVFGLCPLRQVFLGRVLQQTKGLRLKCLRHHLFLRLAALGLACRCSAQSQLSAKEKVKGVCLPAAVGKRRT